MQQQDVEVVDTQALQDTVDTRDQVLVAEVVATRRPVVVGIAGETNATLGLNEHAITPRRVVRKNVTEQRFTMPGTVDVSVVKQVYAGIQRAADQRFALTGIGELVQVHASEDESRRVDCAFDQRVVLHINSRVSVFRRRGDIR